MGSLAKVLKSVFRFSSSSKKKWSLCKSCKTVAALVPLNNKKKNACITKLEEAKEDAKSLDDVIVNGAFAEVEVDKDRKEVEDDMAWHLVGNVLDKVFDYMLGAKSWDNVNLNLKASLDEASPLFEAYIDYVMEKKENKVADEASVPFLTDTVVYELASEDSVSLVERVSFDAEDDNEANEDMAIDTLRDESLTNLWSRGSGLSEVVVLVNGMLHEGGQVVVCGLQGPMITRIQSLLTPHRHPMNEIQVKGLEHSIAGKESAMEDTRSVMSKRDAVSKKEESKRDAAGFGFDLLGSGLSYISSCFCTTGFVAFLLLFEYLVLFSSELFLSSTPFFHRLLPSACAFDDGHNSMGLQSIALVLALVMFLQRVE